MSTPEHRVASTATWRRDPGPGHARMVLRPFGDSPLRQRGYVRPRRRPSRTLRHGRTQRR